MRPANKQAPRLDMDVLKRFWRKVQTSDGCWLWTGRHSGSPAYGRIQIDKKVFYAHRIGWALAFGAWPGDSEVLHRCDTPLCVRPSHLRIGSHSDNMRDMAIKGRGSRILNPDKVKEIRRLHLAGVAQAIIAPQFGVSRDSIWRIVHGLNWRHA